MPDHPIIRDDTGHRWRVLARFGAWYLAEPMFGRHRAARMIHSAHVVEG